MTRRPRRRRLSVRRIEVLVAIASSVKTRGCAPTAREICELLSVRSTNTVHGHVTALERRGLVVRGFRPSWRSIRLTPAGLALVDPPEPFREELAIESLDL